MKRIVIIGGGGHAKVVIDTLRATNEYSIAGITDVQGNPGQRLLGIPILGTDSVLRALHKKGVKYCVNAVGSVGDVKRRIHVYTAAKKIGFLFPNIIHPSAVVSSHAKIGDGVYIAPGAVINAGAFVGRQSIINTNACIDHDCRIGDFVHVAPGVTLSGGVAVGDQSHLGTGCVAIQSVSIGAKTVIGAGSVVTSDIPSGVVALGVPCRPVRKNNR